MKAEAPGYIKLPFVPPHKT